MNKSEVELANCEAIINAMPAGEQVMCRRMIQSLLASIGHPLHGRVFMIAVAWANCNVAVTSIRLGLVNEQGEPTSRYPETKREENAALRQIGKEAGNVPHGTKRKAPFKDFAGNELFEGDSIRHPANADVGVIFVTEKSIGEHAKWRVKYNDGEDLPLFLQVDDKGKAVKVHSVDYRLCDGDVDD